MPHATPCWRDESRAAIDATSATHPPAASTVGSLAIQSSTPSTESTSPWIQRASGGLLKYGSPGGDCSVKNDQGSPAKSRVTASSPSPAYPPVSPRKAP